MVSLNSGGYFAWRSSCCRAFQNFNVFRKIWMIWAFRYVYHFLSLDPLFLSKETGQITYEQRRQQIQRYKDVFPSSTWAEASSQLVFMVLFSTLLWTFMNPWNVFTCCTPRLGGSKVISSNGSDSLKHGGTDSGTVWLTDAIHKLVVPHLGLEFFGVHCVSNGGTLDLRNLPSPRAYVDLFGFGPLSRLQANLSYVLVVGLRGEVGPSTRVLNDSMILCYIVFPEVSETFFAFLANRPHSFSNLPPNEHSSSPWQVEKAAPAPSPLIGSQATAWHRHWRMSRVAPIGILGLRVQVATYPGVDMTLSLGWHGDKMRQVPSRADYCWIIVLCLVKSISETLRIWRFSVVSRAHIHCLLLLALKQAVCWGLSVDFTGGDLKVDTWSRQDAAVSSMLFLWKPVGFDSWIEQPSRFSHYPSRLAFRNPTPVSQIMSMYVCIARTYTHTYTV